MLVFTKQDIGKYNVHFMETTLPSIKGVGFQAMRIGNECECTGLFPTISGSLHAPFLLSS